MALDFSGIVVNEGLFVLLICDDDQHYHVWSDGKRFDACLFTYTAGQAE